MSQFEFGVFRLAEMNKGGGLRQKAVGLATQYLNGVGAWVDMPTAMTPTAHSHDIPDLYCGEPDIVAGRILISGTGASSKPTWLDAGTDGQILGCTSGAAAWVDAPSGGSSVSSANPTASVGCPPSMGLLQRSCAVMRRLSWMFQSRRFGPGLILLMDPVNLTVEPT